MNKSTGPNSTSYKILNHFKNDISKQIVDLFNHSFSYVVSSSLLKIENWYLFQKGLKVILSQRQAVNKGCIEYGIFVNL